MVVAKLRGARDRKSLAAGKRIEGRKGHKVHNPALVEAARQARADLGDKASYQTIADRMNASGFTNGAGKALQAMTVKRLLG
jgi:hypothetical protein